MTSVLLAPPRRTLADVVGPARADRRRHGDDLQLARLLAGDDRSLREIYAEHGDVVHAIARRVTASEHLAVDVTQDVFVALWERPDRVDLTRGTLRSYLCVVAHRRSVDAVRRAERRRRAEHATGGEDATGDTSTSVVDADAARWCHERLVDALAQLPEDQRVAVTLAYFEGHTLRDVAVRLGIPEGTAKSRVRLGIAKVRSLVGDELLRELR